MRLSFHIIEMLKRKSGNGLRLPSDCAYLSRQEAEKRFQNLVAYVFNRMRENGAKFSESQK